MILLKNYYRVEILNLILRHVYLQPLSHHTAQQNNYIKSILLLTLLHGTLYKGRQSPEAGYYHCV